MPWNETITGATADEIEQMAPTAPETEAAQDQFEEARAAAVLLVRSDAAGDDTKLFNVHLSGHANPDHENFEGGWLDSIAVSVTQVAVGAPPSVAAFAEAQEPGAYDESQDEPAAA